MFLGHKWSHNNITYSIMNYTSKLPRNIVETRTQEAFEMWASKTPLMFTRVPPHTNQADQADILIYFTGGRPHFSLDYEQFDGPWGTLAHAAFPPFFGHKGDYIDGDAHFDWDEAWTDNETTGRLFSIKYHSYTWLLIETNKQIIIIIIIIRTITLIGACLIFDMLIFKRQLSYPSNTLS